uniref:DUF637 domain-containing protein n=1 Tax=Ralstonia solanacearum TaxID=305 RepID=UPI0018D1BD2B
INGVVAQLNADGSMSAAEAARVAAAVQAGMQAVTSTHTDTFVRSPDIMGEVFAGVVIAVLAVMTGGALGPALSGLASGTFGATVAGGAVGSMTGSAIGQFAANDGINFGKLFTAGAVGALTAGIANGVTVGANGSLGTAMDWSQKVADNSLAGAAGAQSVAGTTMTQAATSAAPNVVQQAEAVLLMSGATAAINTVVNGGSFGRAFLNGVVSNTAAIGAYAIGDGTGALTLGNIATHAALGCVASAAQGTGCAGGAIGAATSAAITPFVLAGLDPNGAPPDLGLTAAVTAIAALAGGGAAAALGQNASAAATWAQNEALNNDLKHFRDVVDAVTKWTDAAKSGLSSALDKVTNKQALYSRSQQELDAMSPQARALMSRADSFEGKPASELDPAEIRRTIVELNVAAQDPSLTVMQRNWMHNAALRAYMVAGQYGWLVNEIGLVTNAAADSMAFSGGGVGKLPNGGGQSNVLPTTTGSRTAVTLGGATNTPSALQQVTNLFSTNEPGAIQIGGSTFNELPNSGKAAVFSGVTDAQVEEYFLNLTGATSLPQAQALTIKGTAGVRYTISTPQGNFTLRNVSSSASQTGPAWTIDVPGAVTGNTYNREIKFLRGSGN